jgi:hemerythrin
MNFMDWNDGYSVGITEIDDQHKHLVNLVNKLHEAMMAKRSTEVLSEVISQLIEYTGVHFATEEQLFARFSYPDTAPHVAEHQKFVESVETFYKDFQNKRIGVSIDILNFLTDWLKNHILGSDKKYGPFITEKLQGLTADR